LTSDCLRQFNLHFSRAGKTKAAQSRTKFSADPALMHSAGLTAIKKGGGFGAGQERR